MLADVSGKGLPSEVVAGVLLGAVRAGAWTSGSKEHESVFKTAQRTLAHANIAGPLRQLVLVLLRT